MDILIYLLILIIPLFAQLNINFTYKKYKQVKNTKKLCGQEVARQILDMNGLDNVYVVESPGNLTDCYDGSRKTIRLSTEVFHGETIAAISVAAHECGHAIQDKEGYSMYRLRHMIFPVVSLGTKFSYAVILMGFLAQMLQVVILGIALVSLGLIFQLVTLPVEFDASNRALKILEEKGFALSDEIDGCKKMLKSAALTYVAGVLSSALEIIRLIIMFTGDNRK